MVRSFRRMHLSIFRILAVFLPLQGGSLLQAQASQSSFEEVRWDRAMGVGTSHGGVEVEAATGRIEFKLPLGPGIGMRGVEFRPTLSVQWAPSARVVPLAPRYSNPQAAVLWYPSALKFGRGCFFDYSPGLLTYSSTSDPTVCFPDGSRSCLASGYSNPNPIPPQVDAQEILSLYGLSGQNPLGMTVGMSGELWITLGDADGKSIEFPDYPLLSTTWPLQRDPTLVGEGVTTMPYKVLVVRGGIAYLYTQINLHFIQVDGNGIDNNLHYERTPLSVFRVDAGVQQPLPGPTKPMMIFSDANYRLEKIINRQGESVDFTYTDTPRQGRENCIVEDGYKATWVSPDGKSQSIQINGSSVNYIDNDVKNIPYYSFEINDNSTRLGTGVMDSDIWFGTKVHESFYRGSSQEAVCALKCVKNLVTNERIDMEYAYSAPGSNDAYPEALHPLPSSTMIPCMYGTKNFLELKAITRPGRRTEFNWSLYKWLNPLSDMRFTFPAWGGAGSFTLQDNNLWPGCISGTGYINFVNYSLGVDEVRDIDTVSNQTRITTYDRRVPEPDFGISNKWIKTNFDTIVGHPNGTATTTFFTQPLQNESGWESGASSEKRIQSQAFLKHTVREVRTYSDLATAKADRDGTTAETAQRVEVMDRFSVRQPNNSSGEVTPSDIPYSTRQRVLDRIRDGVVTLTEKRDWDPAAFAWKRETQLVKMGSRSDLEGVEILEGGALGDSGYAYRKDVTKTFDPVPQYWSFGRLTSQDSTQSFDSLPGASTPGLSRISKSVTNFGGSDQERQLDRVASTTQKGSTDDLAITTVFSYDPNGGLAKALQIQSIATCPIGFTDPNPPGIANYGYDEKGYLNSIQPFGVNWKLGQETDSFTHTPIRQTDANDMSISITRDEAGRITRISPPDVNPTDYVYDENLLDVKVNRGEQASELCYNGFGELVLERRWSNKSVSSKAYGFDLMGRNIWIGPWIATTGSKVTLAPAKGQAGYEQIDYDKWGRITRIVNPNQELTEIIHSGLNRTVITGQKLVNGVATPSETSSDIATTTFQTDALGRLVMITDAMGQATEYRYDPAARITKVIQWSGGMGALPKQERTWQYDGLGRLIQLLQPESGVTAYSDFSISGKPRTTTYIGDGTRPPLIVSSSFDSLGRLVSVGANDSSVKQSFFYDQLPGTDHGKSNGKIISDKDGLVSRSFTYSGRGGKISGLDTQVLNQPLLTQTFSYDLFGNRDAGTVDGRIIRTPFDPARGLPRNVNYQGQSVAKASYGGDQGFDGDGSWNLRQLGYEGSATSYFSYDDDQVRLHSMTHAYSDLTKGWVYKYGAAGRLLNDSENEYHYDRLNRLVAASVPRLDPSVPLGQIFVYDSFGNMVEAKTSDAPPGVNTNFTFDRNDPDLSQHNRLPKGSGASYDDRGNVIGAFTIPGGGPHGNLAINMTYDALGRVVSMTDQFRGIKETYQYTAEGLRTVIEERSGNELLRVKLNYYNDLRQIVSQWVME